MEERININVSATDYEKSSNGIRSILTSLEEMVHEEECFVISDSERLKMARTCIHRSLCLRNS